MSPYDAPPQRPAHHDRSAALPAGGFRLSDGFISPLDLIEIGLMSREEAEQLHAMETAAGAAAQ